MDLAIGFLNALWATAAVGIAAKFALQHLSGRAGFRFAAFCLALGFALGRYSYSGVPDRGALVAACAAAGSLVALAGLWAWLVRTQHRSEARPTKL